MAKSINSKRIHRHALPSAVLGIDLIADSDQAVVGCLDGVYQLNLTSGEHEKLYDHESYVSRVVYLADKQWVISCGYDGRLTWFDLTNRSILQQESVFDFWCWDMAVSKPATNQPTDQKSGNQRVAVCGGQYLAGDYQYRPQPSDSATVKVFDAVSKELLAQFQMLPPVQAVAISDDQRHVAAANLMGDVTVWDIDQKTEVASWNTPDFTGFGIIKSHCQIGGVYAATFTPQNELLVCGMGPMRDPMAGNGKQRWQRFSWQQETAKKAESNDKETGEGLMETLCLSPDGKQFVMGGRLRGGAWSAAVFDLDSGGLIHSIKSDSRVTQARYSKDGGKLYLAGAINQSGDPNHKFGVVDIFEITPADESTSPTDDASQSALDRIRPEQHLDQRLKTIDIG